MKKKMIVGRAAACLILFGSVAATANKGSEDDSLKRDDKNATINSEDRVSSDSKSEYEMEMENESFEIEVEEEHGKTYSRVEVKSKTGTEDSSSASQTENSYITLDEAKTIALKKVPGTITKVEKEIEHGRLEYKFELQTDRGETEVRVDGGSGEITRLEFDDVDDNKKGRKGKKDKDDD